MGRFLFIGAVCFYSFTSMSPTRPRSREAVVKPSQRWYARLPVARRLARHAFGDRQGSVTRGIYRNGRGSSRR